MSAETELFSVQFVRDNRELRTIWMHAVPRKGDWVRVDDVLAPVEVVQWNITSGLSCGRSVTCKLESSVAAALRRNPPTP